MDLALDADQTVLLDAATRWLASNMPLAGARERDPRLLADMSDMGWIGMTCPEIGLDHASEALVFAEMGKHLAPLAAMPTSVAARWLGAAGRVALAVPDGEGLRVFDGKDATLAVGVWEAGLTSVVLPANLAQAECLDPSTTMAILAQPPSLVTFVDRRAGLHFMLLSAAYGLGCAEAARDMAAGHALLREQFGRQIGAFQAIKHICADMAVNCAAARSQLCYAACSLDNDGEDAAYHVAAAKRLAENAAIANARSNIQVHGGIGMTDEAAPHLLLKRAHLLSFVAPVRTVDILGT